MCGSGCRLLAFALLALAAACMQAQANRASAEAPTGPARSVQQPIGIRPVPGPAMPEARAVRQLVRAAGTIFSGTVTSIEPWPAAGGRSLGTVTVTFHVNDAIRGSIPGENITISQWIGLWSSGQRYRVGERVVLFLYPASRLGLTSSVAGPMGRFEMDAARRVLISAQHRLAFRSDPILGGKAHVSLGEMALAVRKATEEERSAGGTHAR